MAYTPKSFAVAVLKGLGMPVTPGNVRALVGWEKAEGGHWHNQAHFNPLNTTQPEPGAGNTGSQGNIKVYRSPQQGVQATVQTLKNGRYANILAAFANGHNPGAVARAIGASPWGTSGGLVAQTIGATPAPGHIPAGNVSTGPTGTRTTTQTTSVTPDAQQAQRAALAQFVLSNRPDPLALAENYAALGQQTQTTTRVRTSGGTSSGGVSQPSGAAGSFKSIFEKAASINAKHLPYQWGGGHGPTPAKPGVPLDCSGAVSEVLGVTPRVAAQFKSYGGAGKGRHVTIWAAKDGHHVLMEINGHFWGTSGTNPGGGAGWIPRAAISSQYLSGFVARHPPGL